MRISDWSSDVCSSDLEKVKQRPRCGEYPSRRHNVRFRQSCEPTVAVTASRYPARRDAKQQDQWDGKQRPTQIGHSELSPGRHLIHRTCSPTWSTHSAGFGASSAASSSRPTRSEDHKSELQFIMPISYSVFI